MNELIITQMMQTEKLNCVSASMAMILDYDVDLVTGAFDKKYHRQEMEPWDYLDKTGIKYRRCMAAERTLKDNHVYLMTVPSLNMNLGLHCMVVQMNSDGTWYLLDPNKGKEGRLVYGNDEGESNLVGWTPFVELSIRDILSFREGK